MKPYVEKMKNGILAEESVNDLSVVRRGYDSPGFARNGERVWFAQVRNKDGELRGMLQIHRNTK